jgi:proton glutamate symport protein
VSLSTQVLIGFVTGIAAGIFLGELAEVFITPGNIFVMLLQMTVLPYMAVSLISGLGRLTLADARAILLRGGAVLVLLWVISLLAVLAIPLAFPTWESAAFFSTSLVEAAEPIDFLRLYIPANPFYSMANSLVPAMVLFCILLGVALIGLERKGPIVEAFDTLAEALMVVTGYVARLAPLGVFALAAQAAGTMHLEDLERIQVYLATYAALSLLLGLWVLPGIVTSLTPLSYRDVIGRTRDALITAFATGNLLIVLPILIQECKRMLEEVTGLEGDALAPVDVIVPASYNFPSAGKLLSLGFVPFAAWFVGADLTPGEYPGFLATGFVSFFGQTVTAIPFLLEYQQLPSDMFYLFATVDVIASRFGVMLAGVHTIAIAIVGTCAVQGRAEIRWKQLGRFLALSALLLFATVGGLRLLFGITMENEYTRDQVVANMHLSRDADANVVLHREPPPPALPEYVQLPALKRIRALGRIRVGYLPSNLPYSHFNARGDLVGFDVEMAHKLARELGVTLELVPVDAERLREHLDKAYCDVVMSGIEVTVERSEQLVFSQPYVRENLALLVREYRRSEFQSLEMIRDQEGLRVGVRVEPYYLHILEKEMPDAKLIPVDSFEAFFDAEKKGELDALVTTAETGSAWSLFYPRYKVVVPKPRTIQVPLAYPVAMRSSELVRLIDVWIDLKRNDGTIQQNFDYWIRGLDAEERPPRWSVVRDVLGWVD